LYTLNEEMELKSGAVSVALFQTTASGVAWKLCFKGASARSCSSSYHNVSFASFIIHQRTASSGYISLQGREMIFRTITIPSPLNPRSHKGRGDLKTAFHPFSPQWEKHQRQASHGPGV